MRWECTSIRRGDGMCTSTDGCHAREACPAKAGGGHPVIAESAGQHDRSLETLLSRAMTMKIALVPRTRSSRMSRRAFDRELRVQRGTRIIELLVVLDSEVRKRAAPYK